MYIPSFPFSFSNVQNEKQITNSFFVFKLANEKCEHSNYVYIFVLSKHEICKTTSMFYIIENPSYILTIKNVIEKHQLLPVHENISTIPVYPPYTECVTTNVSLLYMHTFYKDIWP